MGHIGKEYTLGLARPVRLLQSFFQHDLFLHLFSGCLIYAVKAKYDTILPFPHTGAHRLHLKVFCHAIPDNTVLYDICLFLIQFFPYLICFGSPSEHLFIFLMYKLLYVKFHTLIQHNFTAEDRTEEPAVIIAIPKSRTFSRVQIKETYKAVVCAQRLHQFHLVSRILLLLQLLFGAVQQKALIKHFPVFL